jgi:hypothetical protein
MHQEIEADYQKEWENEETQCEKCTSFSFVDSRGYCSEGKCEVSPTAHCDYFQSTN